jgi:hypothetical protein
MVLKMDDLILNELFNQLNNIVILSAAKNLIHFVSRLNKILRYAQNDTLFYGDRFQPHRYFLCVFLYFNGDMPISLVKSLEK